MGESLSLQKLEIQSESDKIDNVWNKQDSIKNFHFIDY